MEAVERVIDAVVQHGDLAHIVLLAWCIHSELRNARLFARLNKLNDRLFRILTEQTEHREATLAELRRREP